MRIAVVDDHQIFLDGLTMVLSGFELSIEIDNFVSPVVLLNALRSGASYDLIISDLVMRDMNGLALVKAIRSDYHDLPILIVSGIEGQPPIKQLKQLRANGFVHKSTDQTELKLAVKQLLNGVNCFQDANGTDPSRDNFLSQESVSTYKEISPRQIEILRLVSMGKLNKQVAAQLSITESTVKSHLSIIYEAYGVNNRSAAIERARSYGLI